MNILRQYTETPEWRKMISTLLGTKSKFFGSTTSGGHWISKTPNDKKYWNSVTAGVQTYNPSEMWDNYCSLYSLYHELQYVFDLPNLYTKKNAGENRYKLNKQLLKKHLTIVTHLPWKNLPEWDNWPIPTQKKQFLNALSKL